MEDFVCKVLKDKEFIMSTATVILNRNFKLPHILGSIKEIYSFFVLLILKSGEEICCTNFSVCVPFSLIYIKVMNAGTTCGTGSRVQAATASNLVALGFYKSNPSNVAPDWGLIIGTKIRFLCWEK